MLSFNAAHGCLFLLAVFGCQDVLVSHNCTSRFIDLCVRLHSSSIIRALYWWHCVFIFTCTGICLWYQSWEFVVRCITQRCPCFHWGQGTELPCLVFDTIQHAFKTTNTARLRHSNNKRIHFIFSAANIVTGKVHSHRSLEKNHFYIHWPGHELTF